jgi:PAS domain S-box-containing protein
LSDLVEGRIVEGLASELIGTREQLEIVLRNVTEGVTVVSPDGRFLYANDAAARLIGIESPEDLLTLGYGAARERYELFRADGSPLPVGELPGRRALAGEQTEDLLVRFRPAGGGPERMSVVRAVSIVDEAGRVQYVINFFREVTEERRRAAREAFAADAGGLLGGSLDYESTLRAVAERAVPELADFCTIDLVYPETRTIQRIAAAYADADKGAASRELYALHPPTASDADGPGAVLRTGETWVVHEITDDDLVAAAVDDRHLELLRTIAPRAVVAVPVGARGRILGVVTLGMTEPGREFTAEDVELAEDLARRAAVAIDNSLLFRETQRSEQRLRVQHAVTRILAEASSVDEAMPRALEAIAELLAWDVGAYWPVEPGADDATARFVHAPRELEEFARATLEHGIRRGVSLAGEIWLHAEPRWVVDLRARDDFPQVREAARLGIRTGFGFPALVGDEVVAIVEFFSREEREPDAELLDVVGALGRNIGQLVQRRRLFEREQEARAAAESAAATLRKLTEISEVALAHTSLRGLLNALLERIVDMLDADTAAILLLDDSGKELTLRATIGFEHELSLALPVPLGVGLAGHVAATRRPMLVDDLDQIELASPVLKARGIKSVVAVPLVVEDRVIGVAHAGTEEPRRFAGEDAALLELVADRIALAINQSALREAERAAQDRLEFLAEASALLASSLEYEETLTRVAHLAVPRVADWCTVDMLAADGAIQRLAVAHVDPDKVRWAWEITERVPIDPDAAVGVPRVLRTLEPELTPEITPELLDEALADLPELREPLRELGLRSSMIVPLVARGRAFGAITFIAAESGKTYDETDLAFAQDLAARAAIAVDNARLYRAAGEGRERLAFLADASALLASALDSDTALARLGDLVVGRIADWCSVHLLDDQGLPRLVALAHTDPEKAAAARAYAESIEPAVDADYGVPYVLRTGKPELWPVIPDALIEGPVREVGIHSCVIVPLRARGRTLGALTLVRAETSIPYTERDLEFAADLGRRAGVAVDNAELYREAADRAQAARILASVGDGVMLVDRNGIVRYWNRAAAVITGLEAEDVVDRPVVEAIPGWAAVDDRIPVGSEGATNPRAESLPLVLGNRELWLSTSGVEVADGVVYAFRDLTEERALEEMKTEFVSTVSHELRTPLAAIYGAAMTLRRGDVVLDSEQRDVLLGVISNEADRLARTVNDILYASRIDTDTLKVAIESCDPLALAREVVDAQRAHLPSGIEVHLVAVGTLPPVAADPDKVRQVLVNLVENAVKYSPDGGRVEVRLAPVGAHVRFAVVDEGLGIPYAEQRRVFEKFYRLDPNMTRGIGGTGLGLYICREIIRRMHGRIWVESEPERGSTFTFELPVADAEPVP